MIRRAAVVLSLVTIAMTACGIPSEDQPRAIPDPALPEQVVEPRGETPSTTPIPGTSRMETIYFVTGAESQERLWPAQVSIDGVTDPSQLPRRVIERLIRARPEEVNLAGVATNNLPSDVQVLDAVMQPDGVLDLNLTQPGIEGPRLRLAMAQLVFTATDLPNVNSVRLFINGNATSVPTPQGDVEGPVSPSNYPNLNPFGSQEGAG
jgi:spore germination protein GerM